MNIAERAKAIVIQLETLRDEERLASGRKVLTRGDCNAARDALIVSAKLSTRPTYERSPAP
jgi:hypothetical protein